MGTHLISPSKHTDLKLPDSDICEPLVAICTPTLIWIMDTAQLNVFPFPDSSLSSESHIPSPDTQESETAWMQSREATPFSCKRPPFCLIILNSHHRLCCLSVCLYIHVIDALT